MKLLMRFKNNLQARDENIDLKELIRAIRGELPASKYADRGFFWLAEKCASKLEEALDLIKDRDTWWEDVKSHCEHLKVISNIRKQSKSPIYQVVMGIISDLHVENKVLKEQVEHWKKRFKEKIYSND